MDTQNTRVHIGSWHRDFWLLAIANFVLSAIVYMQLSTVASLLNSVRGDVPALYDGLVIGIYGLGIFILGPYCNYLTQRYRRKLVCVFSIVMMFAITILLDSFVSQLTGRSLFLFELIGLFWFGAFFGLAQMVLSSTLIIDTTESVQRTEANYASAWFRRFAIAVGPLLAIVLPVEVTDNVLIALYAVLVVLLYMVRIPFKSPDDDAHLFGSDRFMLRQGKWLALTLLPITIVLGMSVALAFQNETFFIELALGFFIAILAEKFMFANADLMSEFITGCILLIAALLLYMTRSGVPVIEYIAPCMIGIGTGLVGSRILMFFTKLAHHCQRGTAQSSFFLSWESGFAIGLFLTEWVVDYHLVDIIGLALVIFALVVYRFFTHPWYLKHRSR